MFLNYLINMMPTQKPGKSRQDYQTPDEFMAEAQSRFGPMVVDLAADEHNAQASRFITEAEDSLKQDWLRLGPGNLWLNPPYSNIEPWAQKCADHADTYYSQRIFLLVPASVGSNWYMKYVHNKAYVLALNPRLIFKGCKTPYPKDCILAIYGEELKGFDVWRWK